MPASGNELWSPDSRRYRAFRDKKYRVGPVLLNNSSPMHERRGAPHDAILFHHTLQKLPEVDNRPFVVSFADKPGLIKTLNPKSEFSSFNRDQLDLSGDFHADPRRGDMAHVDMRPDRPLFGREAGAQRLNAGLLDKSYHHGRGEDRGHVAEAGPGVVDLGNRMTWSDDEFFPVTQADLQRVLRLIVIHTRPSLMLIGQTTGCLPSPQSREKSAAKLARISSRPASRTRCVADQVDT